MPMGVETPTTSDGFLDGRLVVRQPAKGYRAGSDPAFMAAAVQARPGERVLDMGCGVGTASLCLLARCPEVAVTGLELQAPLAALARANAEANGLGGRLRVVEGSVLAPPAEIEAGSFDHVMTNPPWFEPGTTRPLDHASKHLGHVEGEADLPAWLKACCKMLRHKGRLVVVHRADRLADILAGLKGRGVGEVRVFPLWPKEGKAATRVIVSARKGMRGPLEILPGLLLHHADGRYTDGADAVLRHAAGLNGAAGAP